MSEKTQNTPRGIAVEAFKRHFGHAPELAVRAPGRVNLIGEHTDYNDGFVLPCAIDYETVVAASPRKDGRVIVVASDYKEEKDEFLADAEITRHPDRLWANYVRGVVKFVLEAGHGIPGAELAVSGNVPQGAGLSSSASFEVALGLALVSLFGLKMDGREIALNGQRAENRFVGCQCGIMDQFISSLGKAGHALLIDCRSLETRPVAMPEGMAVIIANSNIRRGLVGSEYNARRAQCEAAARFFGVRALRDLDLKIFEARGPGLDALSSRRARHVITENGRVLEAAEALANGNLRKMGRLMAESHASMKNDFEITVPAIDALAAIMQETIGEEGGARMTGGGFGGCVVGLAPEGRVQEVKASIAARYPAASGLESTIYVCQASAGAGLL